MKKYSVTATDKFGNNYHLQLKSKTSFAPETCDTNDQQEAIKFFENCVISGFNSEKSNITIELNVFEDLEHIETLKSRIINN